VLVFTASQLTRSGTNSTMPAVIISSADFNGPLGIAFDGKGNLWMANQLTTGATAPHTFIVGAATTLNAPAGCNFGTLVN